MKKKCLNECPLRHKWLKIILAMKLTIGLFLATMVSVAATSYSQTAKVSLEVKDATIVEIFKEIESTYQVGFFFKNDQLDLGKKYSVHVQDSNLEEVLKNLLGEEYSFRFIGSNVVITRNQLNSSNAVQEGKAVRGKVSNAAGEPLPGVTVLLKGTTTGTITGIDGNFSLADVPAGGTLVFSFIGMKTQEVAVGSKTNINVSLEEETFGVGEVIVTALGFKREEKALGYSVQAVEGDGLQTVKGIDVGTSLTGKVAGLMVKNSTEFSEAPVIQIRGENPLLVVDGIPYGNMTLRDIPSDDIENISVLKGATASALYGYRGASGAIMITTVRGQKNKGLSVSVNSGTMFTAGYLAIPEMQSTFGRVVKTNADGKLEYVRSGDGSWGPPMEGQEVVQWDPLSKTMKAMPYLPSGKNNFQNFLEQGYILNNNINLVQQGEYGNFRTSVTWVNNKGQYPNSTFDKITFSMGGEMKVNKFLLSSNMSYNKQVSPNIGFSGYTGYDPMYNLLVWSASDYDIRNYKDYWLIKDEVQNSSYTSTNNNPYFDRWERTHSLNRDIFNGSISATYDFTPWLKGTLRSGFDIYSNRQDITVSKGSFQGAGSATVIEGGTQVWGESQRGSFNIGLGRGYSLNNDLLLTADKTIGDFRIEGLGGGSVYFMQDDGMEARTQGGLNIPGFYSLKASNNPASVNSVIFKRQVNSLYGRVALSWKSLLYAESTFRNDWSSTLPESTRSYFYPSYSGSFIVSELLPDINWLSLWKVRSSWTSSKAPAGIYGINSVYGISNNAWGNLSSAAVPGTIRGTDVRPESAETFEVGTMINLFNNRASLDVAYYQKRMYDFIREAGISPASGYNANFINSGEEITRKGVEVSANFVPVKTDEWQWDVSMNWSTYARYYTKLDPVYSADKPWVKVGERVDHYILRDYQRDPQGNIIHNNGLPLYSAYDSKFGFYDPDWIWGVNSALKYNDWTLNVSVDGRVGGIAQTTTEMYMWRAGSHPKSVVDERYLDATQPGTKNYIGEGVKVISGSATYDTYGNITTDTRVYAPNDVPVTYKTYIENLHKGTAWGGAPSPVDAYSTTFFKLREISLTYNLPASLSGKIGAQNVSVSAIGQNVMLWAKQFKYSDPDGGSENFSDPSLRYLGFNLKVTF